MNIILCSKCQKPLDATDVEYFTKCECSDCGAELIVPKRFGKIALQIPRGSKSVFEIYDAFDMKTGFPLRVYIIPPKTPEFDKLLDLGILEKELLEPLHHNNIRPVYSSGMENGSFYVTEKVSEGCYMDSYNPAEQPLLEIDNVIEIIKSAALALATAHHREILHHNVTAENIHVDSSGNVQLCGFFASRFIYDAAKHNLNVPGNISLYFISPEKIISGEEDAKGDVFSLGVVFYYLLTGQYPFDGADETEILYSRVKKHIDFTKRHAELVKSDDNGMPALYRAPEPPYRKRPEIPRPVSELLETMLSYYPVSRPSVPHALDVLTEYQAALDKEKNFLSAQRKKILSKTIAPFPKKEGGLKSIFKNQ